MSASKDREERCPHCGYCPHCGRADTAPNTPYPVQYTVRLGNGYVNPGNYFIGGAAVQPIPITYKHIDTTGAATFTSTAIVTFIA